MLGGFAHHGPGGGGFVLLIGFPGHLIGRLARQAFQRRAPADADGAVALVQIQLFHLPRAVHAGAGGVVIDVRGLFHRAQKRARAGHMHAVAVLALDGVGDDHLGLIAAQQLHHIAVGRLDAAPLTERLGGLGGF